MAKRIGSAVEPFVVGQDPKRRLQIEAQLFKDFAPKDVLEEIWLSDIAVLTASVEYYRQLEAAVTIQIALEHDLERHLIDDLPDNTEIDLSFAAGSDAFRDALGEFTKADVERIGLVADLITKMRRERDRIYLLFERKRRPALLNAIKVAETASREKYAIDSLSD